MSGADRHSTNSSSIHESSQRGYLCTLHIQALYQAEGGTLAAGAQIHAGTQAHIWWLGSEAIWSVNMSSTTTSGAI